MKYINCETNILRKSHFRFAYKFSTHQFPSMAFGKLLDAINHSDIRQWEGLISGVLGYALKISEPLATLSYSSSSRLHEEFQPYETFAQHVFITIFSFRCYGERRGKKNLFIGMSENFLSGVFVTNTWELIP